MAVVYYGSKIVLKQDMRFYVSGIFRRFEGKYKIYFAAAQHIHQISHRFIADIEFHSFILLHEFKDGLREDRTERICHSYVQFSDKHILQVNHSLAAFLGSIYSLVGKREQLCTCFGECHAMAVSNEKFAAEFIFKVFYVL